jgi:transposase
LQPEFTIQRQRTLTSFARGVVMVARSLMGARGSSGGPSSVARTFVGVDVSKSFVDIADTAGRKTRVGNNVAALIGVFTGPWSREACANMVCEATGGYARALMHVAGALGLPLRKIHPNRARAFAKARRRLAKTDAIDAETLAAFAAVTAGEEPLPQKSSQQQELAEMVSRLGQLKDQRQSESCRAKQAEGKLVRAPLKTMLDLQVINCRFLERPQCNRTL